MNKGNISIFELLKLENSKPSILNKEINTKTQIPENQNNKNNINNNNENTKKSDSVDYFRCSDECETIESNNNEIKNKIKIKMTSKHKFNINDFDILSCLGKGSYAEVFKAKYKKNNEIYSIKVIDKKIIGKENKTYQIYVENEMLNLCNFLNIISIYGYYEDNDNFFIVEEYCSKGDLSEFLINNSNKLSIDEIKFIIAEIVLSLEYLSSLNIIHRDIKPENFLIDDYFNLKLIDFATATFKGKILNENTYEYMDENKIDNIPQFYELYNSLSFNQNEGKKIELDPLSIDHSTYNMKSYVNKNIKKSVEENEFENEKKQKFVGTANYMPPESIKNNYPVGQYSDIWSLAVILYQIFTGNIPFTDKTQFLIFQNILNGKYDKTTLNNIDKNAKDLIENILIVEPNKRLGYDSNIGYNYNILKNHPFFLIDKNKYNIIDIRRKLLKKTIFNQENINNKNDNNCKNIEQINKDENINKNKITQNGIYKDMYGNILKKGILKKKSPYFYYDLRKVILYDTPRLDYYDTETKELKGTIILDKSCSAELIKNNQFLLKTPKRNYTFMCKEKYDISSWVNIINESIKNN